MQHGTRCVVERSDGSVVVAIAASARWSRPKWGLALRLNPDGAGAPDLVGRAILDNVVEAPAIEPGERLGDPAGPPVIDWQAGTATWSRPVEAIPQSDFAAWGDRIKAEARRLAIAGGAAGAIATISAVDYPVASDDGPYLRLVGAENRLTRTGGPYDPVVTTAGAAVNMSLAVATAFRQAIEDHVAAWEAWQNARVAAVDAALAAETEVDQRAGLVAAETSLATGRPS
jgi:hypothetical protein